MDGPPIDGTLRVFGVAGDTEVPLPAAGWQVDGPELYVKPPLMGFDAVRVAYEYEVDD